MSTKYASLIFMAVALAGCAHAPKKTPTCGDPSNLWVATTTGCATSGDALQETKLSNPVYVCKWTDPHYPGAFWFKACPAEMQRSAESWSTTPTLRFKKCTADTLVSYCSDGSGSGQVATAPPFDVAPREWDGPSKHYVTNCSPLGDSTWSACSEDIQELDHHEACADKSRVLLHSEDGKGHCYDFARFGTQQGTKGGEK